MEIEEKKMANQRLQNEMKESMEHNNSLQNKLDEYIEKYKKQIDIFEEKSMKHIKDTNEIHGHYRGYKTKAIELEARIGQYRQEAKQSQREARNSKKQLLKITFQNDELDEHIKYIEQKYHALIKRCGASQEDIDAIEEEIMLKNPTSRHSKSHDYRSKRNFRMSSNMQNWQSRGEKSKI